MLLPPPLFFVSLQKQCANPYHRASYRAVRCAFTSVITHPHLCLQAGCYTVLLTIRVVSWAGRTACCGTGCSRPGCLGTERVTGQGVYWNTVFSSAAAAVQLQYSRNIVLLCGCFPRPALNFTLNVLPQLYSFRPPPPLFLSLFFLCVLLCLTTSPVSFWSLSSMWLLLHRQVYRHRQRRRLKKREREGGITRLKERCLITTWAEHLVPWIWDEKGGLELGERDALFQFTDRLAEEIIIIGSQEHVSDFIYSSLFCCWRT